MIVFHLIWKIQISFQIVSYKILIQILHKEEIKVMRKYTQKLVLDKIVMIQLLIED
jgi:hypothetical protein